MLYCLFPHDALDSCHTWIVTLWITYNKVARTDAPSYPWLYQRMTAFRVFVVTLFFHKELLSVGKWANSQTDVMLCSVHRLYGTMATSMFGKVNHIWAFLHIAVTRLTSRDAFNYHGFATIMACISNHIHYNVRDEITYPFPNFIQHFTRHVIIHPCWDYN